jgi:hypothetical protein
MKTKWNWVLVPVMVLAASVTTLCQGRIQLVQGRRAIEDKVTFVVDVEPEKPPRAPISTPPHDGHVFTRFAQPSIGRFEVDGKPVGRFDESKSFNSNLFDISYGRHTFTLVFASPAIVTDFYVTIRGGVPREVLEDGSAITTSIAPTDLAQRVVELERKVQQLQDEIVMLKRRRGN